MGIQVHGRNFVLALDQIEPVALHPWEQTVIAEQAAVPIQTMLERGCSGQSSDISLGLGNLNLMSSLRGKNRIAHVVWETTKIPNEHLQVLQSLKQIWTPTTWGKNNLINNGIAEEQIRIVPEGVDPCFYKPQQMQSAQNKPFARPFRFLFVGKWEERKGLDVLLHAYSIAFKQDDSVELILHSSSANRSLISVVEDLNKVIGPTVRASTTLNDLDMPSLYNDCDAFVSATRGEGWGLPIIEAMACARPVIVTNYGGHLEYANNSNAYLVDVEKMIDVDDPQYFNPNVDYGQWAEPCAEHLAHLMRHVYNNREEAAQLGLHARKQVASQWTWEQAASKAHQEIQALRQTFSA